MNILEIRGYHEHPSWQIRCKSPLPTCEGQPAKHSALKICLMWSKTCFHWLLFFFLGRSWWSQHPTFSQGQWFVGTFGKNQQEIEGQRVSFGRRGVAQHPSPTNPHNSYQARSNRRRPAIHWVPPWWCLGTAARNVFHQCFTCNPQDGHIQQDLLS